MPSRWVFVAFLRHRRANAPGESCSNPLQNDDESENHKHLCHLDCESMSRPCAAAGVRPRCLSRGALGPLVPGPRSSTWSRAQAMIWLRRFRFR